MVKIGDIIQYMNQDDKIFNFYISVIYKEENNRWYSRTCDYVPFCSHRVGLLSSVEIKISED